MKANLLDFDADKRKDNFSDSTTIASWVDRFKVDAKANPAIASDPRAYQQYVSSTLQGIDDPDVLKILRNKTPADLPLVRSNAQFAIDTYSEAEGDEKFSDYGAIPGTKLFGQRSSKTGKYINIKDSIDGNTSLGGSEFERHLGRLLNSKLITQEYADDLIKQRAEGFAGEMTASDREKFGDKPSDRYDRETKQLIEEHTKGSEHFRNMGNSIDQAVAAMASGDTKLSEILLNTTMLNVQDTSVRAYAMYGEFDKEFGNLAQRIQGKVSRFLSGTRTQDETDEIRSVLNNFNESYVKPAETKLRDRSRTLAISQGKDPFDVVPPKNADDVKSSKLLSKEQKIEMIKKYNLQIGK